ncbi:MAG: hypothetical protein ACREMQ_15650 [Longimicrobiales bacterium]
MTVHSSLSADGTPTHSLDRRGFLRGSAGGVVAIAFASALPAGCSADYPQADQDGLTLKTLTPKEYGVLRAAAEAFLVGVPVEAKDVAAAIDAELALAGEPMLTDFKTVLGLIEHLTFLSGRRRRFTALTVEQRLAYLRGWSQSRFTLRRGAYQALHGFTTYFAYVRDATRAHTGFTGPWPERVKIAATPVDFGEIA